MAKKEITWESVNGNQLRFEDVGQVFEGYLIQIDMQPGIDDNMRGQYLLKNEDGLHLLFGTSVLDRLLQNGDIGGYYRITFQGWQKSARGFDVKLFAVEKAAGVLLEPDDVLEAVLNQDSDNS